MATPRTPRRVRLRRHIKRNRRRFDALKAAGLVYVSMWIPKECFEAAGARAAAMNLHKQQALRAALEVGFRHLRTSDLIRTEQRWRGILGLPVAPRYPGERTDPKYHYSRQRREAREAEAAKETA